MISAIQRGAAVTFPEFRGERVYMRKFLQADGLPADLRRWQPTVDAMLDGMRTTAPIFLMVDQRNVLAGTPHRRPGVHVDGYWFEGLSAHGGGGGHQVDPGHVIPQPGHRNAPVAPGHIVPTPGHQPTPGHRVTPGHGGHLSSGYAETLVLASDVLGCCAYAGVVDAAPGAGGDCSHVNTSGLARVYMTPGVAWRGETGSLLHESIPLAVDCPRTVVRLNVKGWVS